MKKFGFIFIALTSLFLTSCSDFIDFIIEENDRSYIYSYEISEISETEYENLFELSYSSDQRIDYNGFYNKDKKNFSSKVNAVTKPSYIIQESAAARWSEIESYLRRDYGISYTKCSSIESKVRSEDEILYVARVGNEKPYMCLHVFLVSDRY